MNWAQSFSLWLEDEPERKEPLAGERPEGLNELDWLDYQSSFDGENVPVETIPSVLPAWFRLARRWEKKFAVSFKEAGELAKNFIEKLWGRQPTPEEIKELESSYQGWEDLKESISSIIEEIEKEAPEEPEVADWVLTHGNLEKLRLFLQPEEESQEEEEINFPPSWRYLPVAPEEEEDETSWACEISCPLGALQRARNLKELALAFLKARAENLSQPCRERLFLLYKSRKRFFKEEVPLKQYLFFEEKIKTGGIAGRELYHRLKRTKLSRELKDALWKAYFEKRAG